MRELTFIIHRAEEGGYWAEAEGVGITTQGESLDELAFMVKDAIEGFYFDDPASIPDSICWRFESAELAA